MLKIFKDDLCDPDQFVVTLELVPARESFGQKTDTLVGIAKDAFADGRISAVSITDNPGGNPALSPDVFGYEIFKQGMDVIVHFTCRDTNRGGMESRALQLAHMGMKNILALTGDYSKKGTPVFDLDSVLLSRMLRNLSKRLDASGDPDPFFTGCAVSPFKRLASECIAQYKKLDRKIGAGASFVITQLGYDVDKFEDLIRYHKKKHPHIPMLASVYLLSPKSARAMNQGRVPGADVSDPLYNAIVSEWRQDKRYGLKRAIKRAAELGVILKRMGYRGIHIGGIHRSFKTVAAVLDYMDKIEKDGDHDRGRKIAATRKNFYLYEKYPLDDARGGNTYRWENMFFETIPYRMFNFAHDLFFHKSGALAPLYRTLSSVLEKHQKTWMLKRFLEDPVKVPLLSCQSCGDCAIQHTAFLCPESKCPKHTRNGPCGGSRDGKCEVYPEKKCVWVRAYNRLQHADRLSCFMQDTVPPRMWELNKTSAWVNFHLGKDHQG